MTGPTVVFDLDGTLTRTDTSVPFLRYVRGRRSVWAGFLVAGVWGLPDLVRALFLECVGAGPRVGGVHGCWMGFVHERMVAQTLRGMSREELEAAGARFAEQVVQDNLRPDARPRIEEHLRAGHRLVLASASLDVYLEPLRALLGFETVVATRLDFRGDKATGGFEGLPCWGDEKLRRVRAVMEPGEEILHAYGDSPGDHALLEAAQTATVVR